MMRFLSIICLIAGLAHAEVGDPCCDDSDCAGGHELCNLRVLDEFNQGKCDLVVRRLLGPDGFDRNLAATGAEGCGKGFHEAADFFESRSGAGTCKAEGEACSSVRECCASIDTEYVCCRSGVCGSDSGCLGN